MIWWIRFRAYATVNKFIESVKVADETHLPASEAEVLVETVPAEALQIAARKRNAVAMANFAMSFTDETTMGMIHKAISPDWPTGKASVVVTQLLRKFKPEDTMARRVELRQKMNKISMKKGQDPAVLFEQICAVENRYNSAGQVSEEDLIAVILDAAPAEYQAVLISEQRCKGDQLRKEDLEDAMTQYWRLMNKGKKPNEEADSELNLSSIVC